MKLGDMKLERMDLPRIPLWFKALWLFGALVSLGFLGLIVWAIYRLVMHFTG